MARSYTPTDTEMLDALEQYVRENKALLIHDSSEPVRGGYAGLGLFMGRRSLRDALRGLVTKSAKP